MTGRIHSVQSLGTVDGPGVRCVVFMQGCPLRCICCHNPDTWDFSGGEEADAGELCRRILRFRPYFGANGGVTVSGGEPLMQAEFVADLFGTLKAHGIHTALDTSGCILNDNVKRLLDVTDLVLLDHKYPTEAGYFANTRAHLADAEAFLAELDRRSIATWLRRVVIPGMTDSEDSVRSLNETARRFRCVQKIELLPFRNLCAEKYDALGIPFPLKDTPSPAKETMEKLCALLDEKYR
ncbi:MAG: pyruvate formate-lyase-activating protein [Clostridia bacterium]|nr:pyruvate formate-lyase-activating protein [Clostridia bacterium]